VLYFGLGVLSLSAAVIAVATSYVGLIAGAALAGLGNSIFHPADYTILNRRVSPARLGHAFSAHALAGNTGWVLAPITMTLMASRFGWRIAALSAMGVGLVTLLTLILVRDSMEVPRSARTPSNEPAPRAHAFLAVPEVWWSFSFFLLTSAAFGVLQNYVSPLMGKLYGVSATTAAMCLTTYLVGSTVGTLLGGLYATPDRQHDQTVMRALALAALSSVILALNVLPYGAVLPLLAVMGFGVGFTGPSRDLLVRRAATQRLGLTSLGRVYGFVYSGLDSGLAIGPLVFGPFMDRGAFISVLAGVALLQFSAVLVTYRVGQAAHLSHSH
jgi:predicted MFS family arabinose efflux permease